MCFVLNLIPIWLRSHGLYMKSAPSYLSNAKFHAKQKYLKFWTKITLFGYLWIKNWKNYWNIWNQHSGICEVSSKSKKRRTKNGILLDRNLSKLLSYSKSALSSYQNAKFHIKQKTLGLEPNCLIWVFLGFDFKRILLHLNTWNYHPQIYQKYIFNQYNKIRRTVLFFLKVQGPLFVEVQDLLFL